MKYTGIYILLTVLLLLAACTGKLTEGKVVTVTIEPQRFFSEKIAGDKFAIHCVVPSGQSPETYDPTPRQMVQIGQSEAYLQIGYIGFEQVWMQKIRENNPDLKIFDVSQGMQFVKETEEEEHRHEGHGDGHHHHAGGIDPHIWSSIEGAKVIAWNTLNAFIELDKENTEYYWKNYNDLLAEIDKTEKPMIMVFNKVDAFTFVPKEEDDLTPRGRENIDLDELKRTWMGKLQDNCIFISAKERTNIEALKEMLYERVKQIHITRFPYNDFLFQQYDEE